MQFVVQAKAGALAKVPKYGGSPLGRWRSALRQTLTSMMRLFTPDDEARILRCVDVSFPDARVVSELHMLQQEFGSTGLYPANLFWTAISAYEQEVEGEKDPRPGESLSANAVKKRARQKELRRMIGRLTAPLGLDSEFDAGDQRAYVKGAAVCDSGGLSWSGDTDAPKKNPKPS